MAKNYAIEVTTVKKKPTGELDKYGRKVWEKVGNKSTKVIDSDFRALKQDCYKKSKDRNNVYVDYGDRLSIRKTRVVNSVTTTNKDGSKTIQYFRRVRKDN